MKKAIDEMRLSEIRVALDCVRAPARKITHAEALVDLTPKLIQMKLNGHTVESIREALLQQDLDYSDRQIATVLRVPRMPPVAGAPAKRKAGRTSPGVKAESAPPRKQIDITV